MIHRTKVTVVKNKVAPPFKQVEFDIMYGEGISKLGEIIDLGVKAGIVDKAGSWFSYEGQRIGQGRENTKAFLRNTPDLTRTIEREIRESAGLVIDKMLLEPETSDNVASKDAPPESGEVVALEVEGQPPAVPAKKAGRAGR